MLQSVTGGTDWDNGKSVFLRVTEMMVVLGSSTVAVAAFQQCWMRQFPALDSFLNGFPRRMFYAMLIPVSSLRLPRKFWATLLLCCTSCDFTRSIIWIGNPSFFALLVAFSFVFRASMVRTVTRAASVDVVTWRKLIYGFRFVATDASPLFHVLIVLAGSGHGYSTSHLTG